MKFNILTLFPDVIEPYLRTSILGRAQENDVIKVRVINIRDFATDKHKTVDDTPYGGGPGMVMKVEPIHRALQSLGTNGDAKTVVMAARGEQFTQAKAKGYAQLDELTLISGRYEGIDQRVADHLADEELSVGPYVLAGGELPALTVLEATARLLPGVLGNEESLAEESFGKLKLEIGNSPAEYPHYTKPEDYNGWKVPDVLLSGNHKEIIMWREKQMEKPH